MNQTLTWANFVKIHSAVDLADSRPAWINEKISIHSLQINEYHNISSQASSLCKHTKTAIDTFFDSSGSPITACRYLRGSVSNAFRYMDSVVMDDRGADCDVLENVVYLGFYHPHYGHFITDTLSRSWALPILNLDSANLKFFFDIHDANSAPVIPVNFCRVLEYLGIPKEDIIFGTKSYKIRRLFVPSQLIVLHKNVAPVAHGPIWGRIRDVSLNTSRDFDYFKSKRKGIYISRRLLKSNKRKMNCEIKIELFAQSLGFDIIHPQLLSLCDQLAVYANSPIIIGQAGSGLHNILFAPSCSRLIGIDSGKHLLKNDSLCAYMAQSQKHDIIAEPLIDKVDEESTRVAAKNIVEKLEALI